MRPGHFDVKLLPRVRKAPQGQGELFSVADVAPAAAPETSPVPETDGQLSMFPAA